MRFGIREICNVVFRAKTKQKLGSRTFYKNEPVLYFDTLKTSNLEGAATTVYAQGGRGNPRLIAWEGERTLTFTMEDALLSPEGLSILTGAGLIDAKDANNGRGMFVHTTDTIDVKDDYTIVLPKDFACWTPDKDGNTRATGDVRQSENIDDYQNPNADIFVMVMDDSGNIIAEPCIPTEVKYEVVTDPNTGKSHPQTTLTCYGHADYPVLKDHVVFVDYYVRRTAKATQIEITADQFGGSYYIEADTLFRREGDNYDMPATFVIPNGKVQSNFTFAMAATGDPSTFTFTVDAMPDFTKFDRTHKILAGILIIEDEDEDDEGFRAECVKPFKQTATVENGDVSVSITNNSEDSCTITVRGTDVTPDELDPDWWGDFADDAIVLEINMPVDGAGEYKLVSKNPTSAHWLGKDDRIQLVGTDYVKTQTRTLTDNDTLEMKLLIGNSKKDVTVEFSKGETLVKTYTIKSTGLTFA